MVERKPEELSVVGSIPIPGTSLRSLRELRLARQSFLMIYILIEKEMERRLSDVAESVDGPPYKKTFSNITQLTLCITYIYSIQLLIRIKYISATQQTLRTDYGFITLVDHLIPRNIGLGI